MRTHKNPLRRVFLCPKFNNSRNKNMMTSRFARIFAGSFMSMVLFALGSISMSVLAFEPVPISHVDALHEINVTGHALKTMDRPLEVVVDRQSSDIATQHVQMLTALDGEFA